MMGWMHEQPGLTYMIGLALVVGLVSLVEVIVRWCRTQPP